MKRILCACAAVAAFASVPAVFAVTYNYLPGVVHETDAFASFATTGEQMVGTGIHVEYADGSVYDGSWVKLATGYGGLTNNKIYLQAGNTSSLSYPWLLYNPTSLSIRSVSLDGQPGSTVFDVAFPFGAFGGFSYVGTLGTSTGKEFELRSLYAIYDGISITYSDAVAITGADPLGDVFRRMKIEFAANRLLGPQGFIEFNQDTDNLAFGSRLAPVKDSPSTVPDGGPTLSLFGAGVLGLAAFARRRASYRAG